MKQEHWQALLQEASRLRAAGRVIEAIAAYKMLLAAKPDLPDSWYNLGWLQRQARAFEDALAAYQQALDHHVAKPEEVHLNRAAIYSDYLHRPLDAQRELRTALDRNPRYVQALLNLGNVCEDLGERDPARDAYIRVLDIEPGNTLALARLATASLSPELDHELEARLRSAIEQPGATASQQAGLGFARAAILDAAGQYDDAFATAVAANAASRAAAGSKAHYNRAAQEGLIDRLIETFDRPKLADGAAPAPIFICGLYRSGSTLVEQILAGHGRVTAGGELDLLPTLVAGIADYPRSVATADANTIAQWRDFYLGGLPAQPGPEQIVTDKRPDNFLHIGLIKTIFPNARIVHTCRNPADNLLSMYFLHLDPGMSYALDLEDAAHWYSQYRRLMAHWKSLYGDDILDVDYDALVDNPDVVVRELLEFCGLDWDAGCLEFNRPGRAVRTASVWQVREPLYKRSSGRWRNYASHLGPLQAALTAL
ncbi:sulfotransferase [Sphingomonas sp.]|uniref:tetratricopeptide repeat-containing sulfotransferase family protein n=1 Tax=Sphingomonas sp. TaxID=28214 RepID=UPI00286C9209|nr:sulfotransferase [Sphingomonas sp.]